MGPDCSRCTLVRFSAERPDWRGRSRTVSGCDGTPRAPDPDRPVAPPTSICACRSNIRPRPPCSHHRCGHRRCARSGARLRRSQATADPPPAQRACRRTKRPGAWTVPPTPRSAHCRSAQVPAPQRRWYPGRRRAVRGRRPASGWARSGATSCQAHRLERFNSLPQRANMPPGV